MLAETQLVEIPGGKTAAMLLPTQGFVSAENAPRDIGGIRPGNARAQAGHRRRLDRFRFDHEADDGGTVALDAMRHIGRNQRHLACYLGLAKGNPELSLHREIDVGAAAAALARPSQQARIKHPFGTDQHQPAGFAAVPVIHVRPSRERSLLLAAWRAGSLTEPRQNTEIAGEVTATNIGKC